MFLFQYPEWIVCDFGNWRIREDAPEYVKAAFYEAVGAYENALENGAIEE